MYYVAAPGVEDWPLYGPVRQHSDATAWARADAVKHRDRRDVRHASDGALSAAYDARGQRIC